MGYSRKTRPSPARQTLEKLAVLETQMEGLTAQVEKVLHHLEGNGKPGLLERVPALEKDLARLDREHAQKLADIREALAEAAQGQRATQQQLTELAHRVSGHQDPDNAEHHTIARMWATNPRGVLRWVGAALLALYILERAGVIQALGEWMTRLP